MKMRADLGVNIQLPKPGTGEEQDVITITGYEGKAEEAKQAILAIVNEYVSALISLNTCSWGKFQPSKVMTVENEGILAITRSSAIICNRLEVPNREGNYPLSKFTS